MYCSIYGKNNQALVTGDSTTAHSAVKTAQWDNQLFDENYWNFESLWVSKVKFYCSFNLTHNNVLFKALVINPLFCSPKIILFQLQIKAVMVFPICLDHCSLPYPACRHPSFTSWIWAGNQVIFPFLLIYSYHFSLWLCHKKT